MWPGSMSPYCAAARTTYNSEARALVDQDYYWVTSVLWLIEGQSSLRYGRAWRKMTTPLLMRQTLRTTPKIPTPKDDRIILHFDYDCFYASVFENETPALKALPLGIKQKSILATCNYVARARGVKKLMLISDAEKICPELVLRNGEDLTRFRDVSKRLWSFLRSHSWNRKVERLGLDEVFLDVTDIVEYNVQLLNPNALVHSFFQLSEQDPEKGFSFDASAFFGCTIPPKRPDGDGATLGNHPAYARLLVASHLAGYLRHKLEEDFGYTSTCGVSTNKVLAKLAGTKNKPKNQTTLLNLHEGDALAFMDEWQIRKIPGMGFKNSQLVENHILQRPSEAVPHDHEHAVKITTREVLAHPGMSPGLLEKILGGPGTERGIGDKVWNMLHGVDNAGVKEASDIPTQISIEDTYVTKTLNTQAELMRELHALARSLIRRMRVDLVVAEEDDNSYPLTGETAAQKWLAYPKTLRLSTRVKSRPSVMDGSQQAPPRDNYYNRSSRSSPLPTFVFSLKDGIDYVAERLVNEAILPLFRRLHNERHNWNLALVNICVTNMVPTGNEDGSVGGGRDISKMFKTQGAKLKEFTVYSNDPPAPVATAKPNSLRGLSNSSENSAAVASQGPTGDARVVANDHDDHDQQMEDIEAEGTAMAWDDDDDDDGECRRCPECGQRIPEFAMSAHRRFHALGD
ncbi:impB/mucB/samB family protein [Apiospora rasikravindrae]|uniref:ImpB/mucB/samB family protein n=1 Tax=Apiospora rasikravindrae TaxID=990691 RepID=A0ABR1T001_9PEZI